MLIEPPFAKSTPAIHPLTEKISIGLHFEQAKRSKERDYHSTVADLRDHLAEKFDAHRVRPWFELQPGSAAPDWNEYSEHFFLILACEEHSIKKDTLRQQTCLATLQVIKTHADQGQPMTSLAANAISSMAVDIFPTLDRYTAFVLGEACQELNTLNLRRGAKHAVQAPRVRRTILQLRPHVHTH